MTSSQYTIYIVPLHVFLPPFKIKTGNKKHGHHLVATTHEFHETYHSVTFYLCEKDSKRCSDTATLEPIHTKDETGLPLVREKSGKFKVREKSGNFEKSQGNLRF